MATDKHNYKSLSLRNYTIAKLDSLGKTLLPGCKLSRPKIVEKLVNDRISDESKEGNIINDISTTIQKI